MLYLLLNSTKKELDLHHLLLLMSLLLDLMALLQHGTLDCETKKEMVSIR
jgi:hypothetical protein